MNLKEGRKLVNQDPTQKSSEGETSQIVAQKMGIGSKDTYHKEKYIYDNRSSLTSKDFA